MKHKGKCHKISESILVLQGQADSHLQTFPVKETKKTDHNRPITQHAKSNINH